MNWFKKNIKNISENKYIHKFISWSGYLLIFIATVSIIFNYIGDYSYNLHQDKLDKVGKMLSFRNDVVLIFTTVWLLSLFLNKKIMVFLGLIAFSQVYMSSLQIQELCKIYAKEYCSDNNCDANIYIDSNCK